MYNQNLELLKEYQEHVLNERAHYIGNCSNSFDGDDGSCYFDIFSDVSEFAYKEEEFRDQIDEGIDLFLTKDEFKTLVDIPTEIDSILEENDEYYFYEGYDNIYVAYDISEDIHYFFMKS